MIVKEAPFKTSVNIKFDLGKKEFINRYLATPSHAESLLGLLGGFTGKEIRSHIIIGPYGTGKSLIATVVAGLVSKKVDKRTFNALSKKFNKVHDDIFDELLEVNNIETTYLTVALNGNEGRFRQSVLNSIIRTINENKINITLPGQNGKIIQTVDLWSQQFPTTFRAFKKILKDKGKDIDTWRLGVLNQEKEEIDWFIDIFPSLTSGSEFVVDYKESFIDQIKFVLHELEKKNIGLFIAYDEFGRMLQTIEPHLVHETMQDLQDLAELTNNTADNLHLLLITHRNLAQYLGLLNEEFKNEFQRIEKRFRTYYVESDRFTFIRIVDSYLNDVNSNRLIKNENIPDLVDQLRKYPLFPELNQQEVEKIIIEGTYPIHPVTLYLLPYLSSFFGQNERTLFTFLESSETGGLTNHLNKNDGYYLPSHLFNYFFPSLHEVDTSSDGYEAMKIYKSIIQKAPSLLEDKNNLDVIKFITLWEMAGLQSKFKLTTDFLQFALNKTRNELTNVLTKLSSIKAIRFNRVLGYWELMEGSSFFIEELIKERRPFIKLNNNLRESILKSLLTKRFFLSNDYNDEKSMTRYAEIEFLFSSEILQNESWREKYKESKKSDAIVFYIILESLNDLEYVKEKIKDSSEEYFIYCISKYSYSPIDEQVTELVVVNQLLNDVELLKEDKYLKEELILWREDLDFSIRDFIDKYTSYSSDCLWLYKNDEMTLHSEIALEQLLSNIMFENYSLTPEVRNDSFNRRKINNMQRKAGYTVLDKVINNYTEPCLSIEGQGPDYLIYATVFKNNNFDIGSLDNISTIELKELRGRLVNYLESNPTSSLSDLSNILQREPFGIRSPLIPIFVVSLLRDRWDQLMFYRNDMYIAGVTSEILYKMFEEANEYKYVYYKFDQQYEEFFLSLENTFSHYENDLIKNKPKFIRLNNAMLSWLRSLPRYTQTTSKLNENILWLKEIIRKSEINPQETFRKLYERYNNNIDVLLLEKKEIEGAYSEFKKVLCHEVFKIVGVVSFDQLHSWVQDNNAEVKKKNKFVKSIMNLDQLENWIEEFAYSYLGIELLNWSDITTEMFLRQIKSDFQDTSIHKRNTGNQIEIQYNGIVKTLNKVSLSTKSETIYKNVERMIRNAGRNVPKEEVEYLVYSLLDQFVE
ncbi:UNVERIFIED_ORG: hypothetical protein ABIC97_003436 [Peribacillus simplex]